MTPATPALNDVLEAIDALGPPGTPVTTPEVAVDFDCTQRTIYNRLETLVEEGLLLTKKVGANSRVWWRPVDADTRGNGDASAPGVPVSLREGPSHPFTTDGEMAERKLAEIERERAIEELRESEAALERLNAATQELIDVDTAAIASSVAPLVREVLEVEYASLWNYDEGTGDLEAFASATAEGVDAEAVSFADDFAERLWQTFIGDEHLVEFDPTTDERGPAASPLESTMLVPLGRHGVVCIASTRADAFDERTLALVETVAATVETTWTRAEGEQELVRQNEKLGRLDRLYTLMWRINQALVRANTVDAIDEAICDRLAASDAYEFAWIGDYDATTDRVEPRAWAGVDGNYLDDLVTAIDGSVVSESLFASAARTGERQIVTDVAGDPRADSWREITLQEGARSCLSLPIVYEGSTYGVLAVYGGSQLRDERDADVLADLGRTAAHAMHAVERRATHRTDSVVELTLRLDGSETPLCRLSRETGCVIDLDGLVPGSDGSTTTFFTATGVAPDELVAAGERSVAVTEFACLAQRDEGALFRVRLADPSLASRLLERAVRVRSLTIDAGTATAVVDLGRSADVREFVETLQQIVPDLELLSRRTRTRTLETGPALQTTVDDRLTPRQQEIAQFAYRSGYFESPRVKTGKELSDALDISQSTFNTHLRGAERKLFELVFDHHLEDAQGTA